MDLQVWVGMALSQAAGWLSSSGVQVGLRPVGVHFGAQDEGASTGEKLFLLADHQSTRTQAQLLRYISSLCS